MPRKEQKAVSIVMPIGLYKRVSDLALKSRLSTHAYLLRLIWRDTNWKPEKDKPIESYESLDLSLQKTIVVPQGTIKPS